MEDYLYCWIISLEKSTERFVRTKERLGKAGFELYNIQRWKAIDGNTLIDQDTKNLTPGEVGCFMSHRKLWEELLQTFPKKKYFIVFEDDALPREHVVKNHFPSSIRNLIQEAGGPQEFDFMRFEWQTFADNHLQLKDFSRNLYQSKGQLVNLSSYVITRRGAQKLLHRVSVSPIQNPIDVELAKIEAENDDFISLASKRALSFQDKISFVSEIHARAPKYSYTSVFSSSVSIIIGGILVLFSVILLIVVLVKILRSRSSFAFRNRLKFANLARNESAVGQI